MQGGHFHVYFMEKLNQRFRYHENIHSLTLKSGIPRKRLDATLLIVS